MLWHKPHVIAGHSGVRDKGRSGSSDRPSLHPDPVSAPAATLGTMTDRELAMQAWESLFRAQHELFDRMSADFDDAPITQPEYDVLLTVVRSPDMTARLRDITANSLISQPSVSRLVDRMVSRSLVTKASDPDDGRGALVTATASGARAFRVMAASHGRSIAEHMAVLNDDELRTLLELTGRLRAQ